MLVGKAITFPHSNLWTNSNRVFFPVETAQVVVYTHKPRSKLELNNKSNKGLYFQTNTWHTK